MDPATAALLKEVVTLYGPLGFGWVGFVILLRHILLTSSRERGELITTLVELRQAVVSVEKWVRNGPAQGSGD